MERNLKKFQNNLDNLNKKKYTKPPNYFTHFLANRNITSIGINNKYPITIAIGLNRDENKNENENRNNNYDNYYCQLLLFNDQQKDISVISTIKNSNGPYNCIVFDSNIESVKLQKFIYMVSVENRCTLYECYLDQDRQAWVTRERLNIIPTINKKMNTKVSVNKKDNKKIESIAFNTYGDIIAICNQDTIFLYILNIENYTIIKEYIYEPTQEITNINYINIIDIPDGSNYLIIGNKSKVIIENINIESSNITKNLIHEINPANVSRGNNANNYFDIKCIQICTILNDAFIIAIGCNNFVGIYLFKGNTLSNLMNIYDILVESIGVNFIETIFELNIVIGCKDSTRFYKINFQTNKKYEYKRYLLGSNFIVINNDFFINIYNNLIKFWKLNKQLNEQLLLNNNDQEVLTIIIPSKIKCNPIKLYDYIMSINLNINFIFQFQGESGIDAGGMTRIIFDIIKETYIQKYFMSSRENYIIIKDYDDDTKRNDMYLKLWNDTKQIILLIKNIKCKILLKFEKTLIDVLSSLNIQNYFNYFNNSKRNSSNNKSFKNIYNSANLILEHKDHEGVNYDEFILELNKNYREIITNYKEGKLTESDIIKEIRFRKYMIDCQFSSWKHLMTMMNFLYDIKKYSYEDKFIFDFNFDKKYLNQKLKIIKRIGTNESGFLEYIETVEADEEKLAENISEDLKYEYPALGIFHRYLYGEDSTDEYRKNFIIWVVGTAPTCEDIKIFLGPNEIQFRNRSNGVRVNNGLYGPPSTCAIFIDFYKRPDNDDIDYMSNNNYSVKNVNDIVIEAIKGNVSNVNDV